MRFNLKALAGAAALVMAGQASAAVAALGGASTGSSLLLTVWDPVANVSYVRNLGITLNSFLPSSVTTAVGDGGVTGDKTPEAGLNIPFSADALFQSAFAGSLAENINWGIYAFDSISQSGTSNVSRFATTISGAASTTNAGIAIANGGATSFFTAVNTLLASTNSAIVTDPGSDGFAGNTYDDNILTGVNGSAFGTGFGSLNFVYVSRTQGTLANNTPANQTTYANSLYESLWTLASDGSLSYSLQPAEVAAVPLPAAAWMLGAGVLALGGAIRRRRANEA